VKPQLNNLPAFGNDPRWYAVYLHPRREAMVAKHLAFRAVEYYLPTYQAVHTWKNRCTKHLELPLFPGYLFVRICNQQRVAVLSVPGVVQLVGQLGKATPLSDSEMDTLRLGLSARKPQPHAPLSEGERVRIRSGALAGLEGTLQRGADGPRVVISLDIIAQGASVEVDWSELEPASRSISSATSLDSDVPAVGDFASSSDGSNTNISHAATL
jgi:transcription antitermination factor NusG